MQCPYHFLSTNVSRRKGFSILELIVALSVFTMLTAMFLFNYNTLNKRLTLDTFAHQVAQSVRATQVSAMSVKAHAGSYAHRYGLYFSRTEPDQFVVFADLDDDQKYTPGGTCGSAFSECEKVTMLPKGVSITTLCGESGAVSAEGGDCAAFDHADNFALMFKRPDPDALILGEYSPGNVASFARAEITVRAPSGYSRTIEVWTTGQVSVQ